MKSKNNIFLPAIDVLLLLLMVLLVALFATRYAEKGIGEKTFVHIHSVAPNNEAFLNSLQAPFIALVIKNQSIDMLQIVDHDIKPTNMNTFYSVEDLAKNIIRKYDYVIYEELENNYLSDVIRMLVKANVSNIMIAKAQEY